MVDEGTWFAIIIGMVLGLFYIVASSRKSSKHPVSRSEGRRAEDEENQAEDELDDWDQLEGDECIDAIFRQKMRFGREQHPRLRDKAVFWNVNL